MEKFYKRIGLLAVMLLSASFAFAQTTISGTVKDGGTGETLAGVNIIVKGKVIGTNTDVDGVFNLKVNQEPPLTLVFSFVGYKTQEIEITDANTTGLTISMEEQSILGQEVVVSASRMEESILQSPVSIEKMDILAVQNTASDNYYKGLINLKGLDMTTSSINFQIVNARGFNSTGNTRFVQLTDGMDTQAPALNFPIGNLNGPSELDVESVEFIPGAASALYGPNAFNGILLVNSKSPFEYQGLSAFAKYGVNHIGDSDLNSNGEKIGPGGAKPMYEASIRYAKAFNNKFAFKLSFSYSRATDWYGTNAQDKYPGRQPANYTFNPGEDKVHFFGDEVANSLGLVKLSLAPSLAATPLNPFVQWLPDQIVTRTPYAERDLVDYSAKNVKASAALHYRLTDKLELSYNLNYGGGTSVYTGAQRYSLKDFNIQQHKLELKGDNFFLRGYTTIEDSGDSYIADLTGVLINDSWKGNSTWYKDYSLGYLGYLAALAGQGQYNPAMAPTEAQAMAAHVFGRNAADGTLDATGQGTLVTLGLASTTPVGSQINLNQTRLIPGTSAFNQAARDARSQVIPRGSLFDDATKLYHVEGQYNFKNEISFMDLMIGASYRLYDLNSNGTIFADTAGNDITIQEIGAYIQASKKILNDKLKLTGSIRYDKNENFDAQFNPRISGVYSFTPNHNLRVAYQTGFRNPTTQGQHIDLNVVSSRILGGLPQYARSHNIYENAYDLKSVENFVAQVAASGNSTSLGDPNLLAQLVAIDHTEPVKPEQVQSIEIGYKALIGTNFVFDVAYYHNSFNNFIVQQFLRKAGGTIDIEGMSTTPGAYMLDPRTEQNIRNAQTLLTPITTPGMENTFSVYTNLDKKVTAQGFVIGGEYSLLRGYKVGLNYNWNKLNDELGGGYLSEFNTPEHKFNVTFGNRKVTENIGFNVAYRWQDAFLWESSFAQGEVPAVGVVDAQVSYRLKNIKSVIKLGGSDIFNKRYVLNYGGPTLGAIYYISVTFDQLMN